MPDDAPVQVWTLTADGRVHRVETRGSVSRRLRWYADGEVVAEKRSSSDSVQLTAAGRPELGVVGVRYTRLGRPKRSTLFEHDATARLDASARASAGVGGLDLEPEPGSPAARYEDRVRAHPRRYAVVAVLSGVATVVLPIVMTALAARLAFALPFPDLPRIPWPDLPRIPWPDLPRIPWPDLPGVSWPHWSLPGWLSWVLERAHYGWPVLVAAVLARGEIRRRRRQDELRRARTDAARAGDG